MSTILRIANNSTQEKNNFADNNVHDELLKAYRSMSTDIRHDKQIEDHVSALALGRTLSFILYSLPCSLISILGWEVLFKSYFTGVSEFVGMCFVWILLELALFLPIIKGWLPGTTGLQTVGFSENYAGWSITGISFILWFFHVSDQMFAIYNWVLNGSLILVVMVYFLTKSILSKRLRIEVFLVLIIPALQIYAAESGILSIQAIQAGLKTVS